MWSLDQEWLHENSHVDYFNPEALHVTGKLRVSLSSAHSKGTRLTVVALERKHSKDKGMVVGKDGTRLRGKEGHRHIPPPTPGKGFLEAFIVHFSCLLWFENEKLPGWVSEHETG